MENGKYLIPANATTKETPEEKEGYTRHFVPSGVIGDREMQGYWEYREIPVPEPVPEPETVPVAETEPEIEKDPEAAEDEEQS